MFERFDREVKQALTAAPGEAAVAGATTVSAEHLLLALAGNPSTAAGRILQSHGASREALRRAMLKSRGGMTMADSDALASLGIDLDAVEAAADQVFGPGAFARAGVRPARGGTRFGESAKTALSNSLHECLAAAEHNIGPTHLLLAISKDPAASALLSRFGLSYDTIRAEANRAA